MITFLDHHSKYQPRPGMASQRLMHARWQHMDQVLSLAAFSLVNPPRLLLMPLPLDQLQLRSSLVMLMTMMTMMMMTFMTMAVLAPEKVPDLELGMMMMVLVREKAQDWDQVDLTPEKAPDMELEMMTVLVPEKAQDWEEEKVTMTALAPEKAPDLELEMMTALAPEKALDWEEVTMTALAPEKALDWEEVTMTALAPEKDQNLVAAVMMTMLVWEHARVSMILLVTTMMMVMALATRWAVALLLSKPEAAVFLALGILLTTYLTTMDAEVVVWVDLALTVVKAVLVLAATKMVDAEANCKVVPHLKILLETMLEAERAPGIWMPVAKAPDCLTVVVAKTSSVSLQSLIRVMVSTKYHMFLLQSVIHMRYTYQDYKTCFTVLK
jgi:hypothetical protein